MGSPWPSAALAVVRKKALAATHPQRLYHFLSSTAFCSYSVPGRGGSFRDADAAARRFAGIQALQPSEAQLDAGSAIQARPAGERARHDFLDGAGRIGPVFWRFLDVSVFSNERKGKRVLKTNKLNGEPAGTRTRDPLLKRQMLYRLSYRPIIGITNSILSV